MNVIGVKVNFFGFHHQNWSFPSSKILKLLRNIKVQLSHTFTRLRKLRCLCRRSHTSVGLSLLLFPVWSCGVCGRVVVAGGWRCLDLKTNGKAAALLFHQQQQQQISLSNKTTTNNLQQQNCKKTTANKRPIKSHSKTTTTIKRWQQKNNSNKTAIIQQQINVSNKMATTKLQQQQDYNSK